jgi:Flp pilus assembly protein TadG
VSSTTSPARSRDRERGQATVELALVLPLVVLLLLAVLQVALVAREQVLVAAAARDGARAVAVSGDVGDARPAALAGSGLAPSQTEVIVEMDDQEVRVTVRCTDDTSVPLVGALVGDVTLQATVVMRRER